MIFISHRGNIDGKDEMKENSPPYIVDALNMGYDVEVDVWFEDGKFWLGHDSPKHQIEYNFLINQKLWCHAKNIEALVEMEKYDIHYFWHENDTVTLTSKNYIWAFPTKDFLNSTIAVLPELFNSEIKKCKGVCSDFVKKYKENYD